MRPSPKLACCNFIDDPKEMRAFAIDNRFDGIDWSFTLETLPRSPSEQSRLVEVIGSMGSLHLRYHCAFKNTDLGAADPAKADESKRIFEKVCRLVSKLGGRHLTIHVGLGLDSTLGLSWNRTVERLAELVRFAGNLGIRLCLENLAWGWTSRPELFERLLRKTGAWATLDIGHARVSPWVASEHFEIEDFVLPHAERFLNAHVYHLEDGDRHLPPQGIGDIDGRLELLGSLPSCDWWVLELREEKALMQTVGVVRDYLALNVEGRERSALGA